MDWIKKYTCPGKVFLMGEYLALQGGPVIGFGVEPRFELIVEKKTSNENSECEIQGIPHGSPAFLFLEKNREILQAQYPGSRIRFLDPYGGAGGFGASGAQFLFAYELVKESMSHDYGLFPENDLKDLLAQYFQQAYLPEAFFQPSGADLVVQKTGGFLLWNKNQGRIEKLSWHFQNLDFLIFHTGKKVATHQHIQSLKNFPTLTLEKIVSDCAQSLRESREDIFLQNMNLWNQELQKNGWICPETSEKLQELKKNPLVLAAKGCGALGADLIFLVCEKKYKQDLFKELQEKKYQHIKTSSEISAGLEWG